MLSPLLVCVFLTPSLGAPAPSPTKEIPNLQGYYLYKGTMPGGKSYQGVAVILSLREPNTYIVQWFIPASMENPIGVGCVRNRNEFFVGWGDKGGERGLSFFRIEVRDKKLFLKGSWLKIPGDGSIGLEEMERVSPLKKSKKSSELEI